MNSIILILSIESSTKGSFKIFDFLYFKIGPVPKWIPENKTGLLPEIILKKSELFNKLNSNPQYQFFFIFYKRILISQNMLYYKFS